MNEYAKSEAILKKYTEFENYSSFEDYSKLVYFFAVQYFYENNFSKSEEFLELALDNLNKHNNKLNRLLVNLNSKIKEKNN
jgi:uncharacterized protein (DUF608 family)